MRGINFRNPGSMGGNYYSTRVDEGRSGLQTEYKHTSISIDPILALGSKLTLHLSDVGITTTGGNTHRWINEKLGMRVTHFTGAGSQAPKPGTINGVSAVDFWRGEADYMIDDGLAAGGGGFSGTIATTGYHCFMVVQPSSITNTTFNNVNNAEVIICDSTSMIGAAFNLSSAVPTLKIGHTTFPAGNRYIEAPVTVNVPILVEWWYASGTAGTINLRINSGSVSSITATDVQQITNTAQLRLGRSSVSMSGIIGSIVFCNATCSVDESNGVRNFLGPKYGISAY
jgi:hypothetical protein